MSIDFSKKEDREGYLQAKLDDLLDGINASYGQSLLDELMVRLETTIDDFNKEVDDLMDSLKKSSDEKAGESEKSAKVDKAPVGSDDESDEDRELSEWEKRLEGMN